MRILEAHSFAAIIASRGDAIKGTTGRVLRSDRVEAKYKRSQNKSKESRENVTRHLEDKEDPLSEYMRDIQG